MVTAGRAKLTQAKEALTSLEETETLLRENKLEEVRACFPRLVEAGDASNAQAGAASGLGDAMPVV